MLGFADLFRHVRLGAIWDVTGDGSLGRMELSHVLVSVAWAQLPAAVHFAKIDAELPKSR
jgi:hypothetical protein